MVRKSAMAALVACAACLSCLSAAGRAGAADPPYVIVLRSRNGVVTPEKARDAQTGGGFVQVTQLEPNVVMALMRGTVAAGGHHGLAASMQFELDQDFEILPTRAGLRPPRLVLAGWLIGALESTNCYGGTADHGPAVASVQSGGQSLVNLSIPPHSVAGGQNLLVNDRAGPLEMPALPGCFVLHQAFTINANQPKSHCHEGAAAAEFDPEPKLDSQWNTVLKPFRAVPHRDFGFRIILRVVEDVPPVAADAAHPPARPEKESLPLPKPSAVDQ